MNIVGCVGRGAGNGAVGTTFEGPTAWFVVILTGSLVVGGSTPVQEQHKHMSSPFCVGFSFFIHVKYSEKKRSPLSGMSVSAFGNGVVVAPADLARVLMYVSSELLKYLTTVSHAAGILRRVFSFVNDPVRLRLCRVFKL